MPVPHSFRRAVLTAVGFIAFATGRYDSSVRGGAFEPAAAHGTAAAATRLPLRPDPAPLLIAEPETDGIACEDHIERAMAEPAAPGTPALDKERGVVLLYAKAEPVVFTREPATAAGGSQAAETYRSMLRRSSSPWSLLNRLWPVFSANPELGRSVLLREGYLYADRPELAFALVDLVAAQLLFSDREIWIQRGERTLHAERSRTGHYVFTDGAERGERVRLLLFDRVGTGTPPEPLHRDFRPLRQTLGFDRVRMVHLGERSIVADLRYGSIWVRTLLATSNARLKKTCEVQSRDTAAEVAAFRRTEARRARVLAPLRRAMVAGIEDGLPFDEPITEYGQQDGRLRRLWQQAYLAGKGNFEFQGDKYYVFNLAGRPLVPEVCVDYLFDTIERASGTWWRNRGEPRERVIGKVDFGTLADETRRRANSFIELAQQHPEWLELDTLAESERIPFKYPRRLAGYLTAEADRFRPGDVVLIRGYAPWDKPWQPKVQHVHSFFIYESDPLTGMPITLAGNPGRPLLQTWQFEGFRTPDRSIWTRVRPHLDWLESLVDTSHEAEGPGGIPARLAVDRKDRAPTATEPSDG
jgi:hypothetical protein